MSVESEGRPFRRREDVRFLTGAGRYVSDLAPSGCLHVAFARSQVASGRVISVDAEAARALPGVAAVYLAGDLSGLNPLGTNMEPVRDDGIAPVKTTQPLLCAERVRCLGEPLAMILAESRAAALDAAEAVEIDIESEPCVADIAAALAPGAPLVFAHAADNISFLRRLGDADAAQAGFAAAAHVTTLDFTVTRVVAAPLEPRATLAEIGADGRIMLTTSSQNPFSVRNRLAREVMGVEPTTLQVTAPDVGGSFGMKGALFREDALTAWAAKQLGRPALWASDRSEAFLSDEHGRDVQGRSELALDADGRFLALRLRLRVNTGSHLSQRSLGMLGNLGGAAGVYHIPAIDAEVAGVFTNTSPIGPYRGAGRPEATYAIERVIDRAAREIGVTPLELRRRNLIPASSMPYRTALTFHFDSGDFPAVMARAEALAGTGEIEARRREAASRGRLYGMGVANPVEVAGGPMLRIREDAAWMRAHGDGRVELRTGAMSVGQGLETALSELAAARLGVEAERVAYAQGDTDILASGRGSGGSSALAVSGPAVTRAVEALTEAGRAAAAEALEAAPADLEYRDGAYRVRGADISIALAEVARRVESAGGVLSASAEFLPPSVVYPNGCHICEVEIDPATGQVFPRRYVGVEDLGSVYFPTLAMGQMHGGVAQGLGQALGESVIHDESGQLLTGAFMDYPMPRAEDMPEMVLDTLAAPTAVNPLGAKGVGEAGTVGALSAVMNAVLDALAPLGVRDLDMPATPARVWAAIQAARDGGDA